MKVKLIACLHVIMFYVNFMGPLVIHNQLGSPVFKRNLGSVSGFFNAFGKAVVGLGIVLIGLAIIGVTVYLFTQLPPLIFCIPCSEALVGGLTLGVLVVVAGLTVMFGGDLLSSRSLSLDKSGKMRELAVTPNKQSAVGGFGGVLNKVVPRFSNEKVGRPESKHGEVIRDPNAPQEPKKIVASSGPLPPLTPDEQEKERRKLMGEQFMGLDLMMEDSAKINAKGPINEAEFKQFIQLQNRYHKEHMRRLINFSVGQFHRKKIFEMSYNHFAKMYPKEFDPLTARIKGKVDDTNRAAIQAEIDALMAKYGISQEKMNSAEFKEQQDKDLIEELFRNGASQRDHRTKFFRGYMLTCVVMLAQVERVRANMVANNGKLTAEQQKKMTEVKGGLDKAVSSASGKMTAEEKKEVEEEPVKTEVEVKVVKAASNI